MIQYVRFVAKMSHYRLFPLGGGGGGVLTVIQLFIPREARLINLLGRAGPSEAKPHEFERKIYLYISLKVSALLLSNSEKQSMNDVRLSGIVWSKICIHQESLRAGSNFNCNVHQYSLDTELSLQNLFPFFQKSSFVKDYIEEIIRFVAAVK